jgi:peptidyl-prolyl cis-trans isomerase B (cyclophilin B)
VPGSTVRTCRSPTSRARSDEEWVLSNKREREYERHRLDKRQARQAKAKAKRHRNNVIGASIAGAIVVVTALVIAFVVSDKSPAAAPTPTPTATSTSTAAALDYSPRTGNGGKVPDKSLAQNRTWTATITTNRGTIVVDLYGDKAPQAVANFVTLAQEGYFDQTKCHRLAISIKVLQCGDPTATGKGGPGYTWGPIENAPTDDAYPKGTLAMARVQNDGNSMGSQFFVAYDDTTIQSDSAGGYTVFGKVTSGLDVLQAIADAGTADGSTDGPPASDVIIEGVKTQ